MAVIKNIFTDKMLWIAAIAALLSTGISKPELADINFHTIFSLLSMMVLIQIFENIGLLQYLSTTFTAKAKNTRQLMIMLVILTFFGAMLVTNDVAILIIVPLFFKIAKKITANHIFTVTMIAAAANIGSAFTPFGNTHNLFLLSHYNLNVINFFKVSAPYALIGLAILILIAAVFTKSQPIAVEISHFSVHIPALIIALILTALVFLGIFKVIPIAIAAIATVVIAALMNRQILLHVDYATILVFVCFFVAVGNLSRSADIAALLKVLEANKYATYFSAIGFSQFMSNVPATILVAKFTTNIGAVFLGSNIGGIGTPIASMANLLAYKQFSFFTEKHESNKYLVQSFIFNVILLVVLSVIGWFLI
ncbi:SLC13 family permease [Bombilactobacillus bombi]|uniref:SLC13 family permease n=1 Tax=Bombilactobacillus bombi TaxID=1303590 RepID=UPI0015E62975|nr:SLC13 family permease [Bombilactobacillus bombi]MBA1434815.1 TRAP transporter large permease subunit [Bombilactobacillus bombi]